MPRSFEFKTKTKNFIEIINKISDKYPRTKLLYNDKNSNDIIGYITFEKTNTISVLQSFSQDITWKQTTSKFIKILDKSSFNFVELKKKKRKLKNSEIELLKERIDKLENMVIKNDSEKIQNIQVNNTTKTTTNNINNININLNSYLDPSMDHIKNRDIFQFLNAHGLNGLLDLIEKFYYKNKDNYSLCIEHEKYNEMIVFNGKKWSLQNRDKTIDKILDTCSFKLNSWCEDVTGETVVEDGIKVDLINEDEIEETRDKVNEKRNLLDDPNVTKDKRNDIKLLIYNNSKKILEHIKNTNQLMN